MTSAPLRTSAFDCLVRGFYSLRANWELVPLIWLQQVVAGVLFIASIIALFIPFGLGTFSLADLEGMTLPEAEEILADLLSTPSALLVPLVAGLLSSMVLGLLAALAYCWFQGGIMAVLLAGERQALPGEPRDWRLFRTFEWRSFTGWGGRLMGRYFWLINLYLVLFLAAVLVWTLVIVLTFWGGQRWGGAAAWGIGCGGSLPMVFVLVVLVLWYLLAQADLPREGSSVARSGRRALEVLGRRPGGVLLLVGVYFVASLLLGFGTAPLGLLAAPLAEDSPLAWCFGQLIIYALQMVVSGVLNVAFFGSTVALVHSGVASASADASADGEVR